MNLGWDFMSIAIVIDSDMYFGLIKKDYGPHTETHYGVNEWTNLIKNYWSIAKIK